MNAKYNSLKFKKNSFQQDTSYQVGINPGQVFPLHLTPLSPHLPLPPKNPIIPIPRHENTGHERKKS